MPKPVQRPHPRIWVGATHSEDTFRYAGTNDFDLMTVPFVHPSTDFLHALVKIYRDELARNGHDFVGREVLGKFHIYVSDSFERGVREAAPFMQNYSDIHHAADPERKLTDRDIGSDMARGFIIVGDPERCVDTIRRWHEEGGITTFSGTFHFGGMPQEMALRVAAVRRAGNAGVEGFVRSCRMMRQFELVLDGPRRDQPHNIYDRAMSCHENHFPLFRSYRYTR